MDDREKAYYIAKTAHFGQIDKAGNDYFKHPEKVASMVDSNDEKIVALLHDVIEDTPITLAFLESAGFNPNILEAVDAITKREKEDYDDYIKRVADNPLAKTVKLADMKNNADITRFKNPTEEDFKRADKYKSRISKLTETI